MRRRTGWTIAVVAAAIALASGPALAGRHDRDWRRERDREHEHWRDRHEYVAPPPVVYGAPAVVAPPGVSFSLNFR